MAGEIAVEVQKGYNGEMTKLEHEFETGKTLIDNRYGEQRTKGYDKSKGALKETGGHLKEGGYDLINAAKAGWDGVVTTIGGVLVTVVGVGVTVLGPVYYTGKAVIYDGMLKGGYDALRSTAIAGDAAITTRLGAMGEKGDLKTAHKAKKVKTTQKYAGIAQERIEALDDELVPFEKEEEALRAELARVAAEKAPIIDQKTDVVAERKALEKTAKTMQRWYNNIL